MKKFGFRSMAVFALAAATVFTSCKKDDDGNSVLDLVNSFEVTSGLDGFKTNTVYADKADAKSAQKSSSLFSADKQTTVYAVKDKNFMSITFNGSEKGDYKLELSGTTNVNELLVSYLTTDETLDETIANNFSAETGCLIMYGSTVDGVSTESLYVSTKASVSITSIMKSTKVDGSKVSGTFTATLMNSTGDKKEVAGKFTCLGM